VFTLNCFCLTGFGLGIGVGFASGFITALITVGLIFVIKSRVQASQLGSPRVIYKSRVLRITVYWRIVSR
jgi:hypothetical protein